MIEHRFLGTGQPQRLALLGSLARADAERTRLALDLSPLDEGNPSKRRPSGPWISMISNMLLGRYADLPIKVVLPESHSIQLQLLRNAFYFALAQRPGITEFSRKSDRSSSLLEKSSGQWTPRTGPVLFPLADGDRVEERTYLYANTHVVAESGYFRRYEASAAFPWLGDVVPRPADRLGDSVREDFISATCDTFGEVLDNISTHAFNLRDTEFSAGWLGSRVVDRARSCFLVSLTTGGQRSHDRLHFLALDNGFSVPRTLRWQHPTPIRHDAAGSLMERVLQRRLTDREITDHSGAGLWFLYGLARFAGGTISLISEDDRSDGRSAARVSIAVPPAESDDHSTWTSEVVDVPVRGTVVHLQMRVPTLTGIAATDLARKLDDFRRYRSSWPAMA